MTRKLAIALTAISLLFNSSISRLSAAPVTGAMAPTKDDKREYETRVYVRKQCFMGRKSDRAEDRFIGALAAIFVPLLIERGLGAIAGALKKAGAEETLHDSGKLPMYLYRVTSDGATPPKNTLELNPDFRCVLMLRGVFDGPDKPAPNVTQYNASLQFSQNDASEAARIKLLQDNGIPVKTIAMMYEAEIDLANDATGLRYTSTFFEVNDFQGDRSHDKRAIVISIAISGAGPKEGEPVLSVVLINLGEVNKYTVMGPSDLASKKTGWVGGLGISEASLKALEKIKFPPAPNPNNVKILEIMPITVEGVIAETDEGNKALRFIGEVLDATKGDVSKALASQILDSGKQEKEAADALEKLREAEESGYAAYLDAETSLVKLQNPKPEETRAATFKRDAAKRTWCLKYRSVTNVGITPNPARPEASTCPADN